MRPPLCPAAGRSLGRAGSLELGPAAAGAVAVPLPALRSVRRLHGWCSRALLLGRKWCRSPTCHRDCGGAECLWLRKRGSRWSFPSLLHCGCGIRSPWSVVSPCPGSSEPSRAQAGSVPPPLSFRALDDIRESIKELQFYRDSIFKRKTDEKKRKLVENGESEKGTS